MDPAASWQGLPRTAPTHISTTIEIKENLPHSSIMFTNSRIPVFTSLTLYMCFAVEGACVAHPAPTVPPRSCPRCKLLWNRVTCVQQNCAPTHSTPQASKCGQWGATEGVSLKKKKDLKSLVSSLVLDHHPLLRQVNSWRSQFGFRIRPEVDWS